MEFKGKKILVVGIARSGIAAVKSLTRREAVLFACDRKTSDELGDILLEMEALGVKVYTGSYPRVSQDRFDLLVASPGVPLDINPFIQARNTGVPVMGELELAYLLKTDTVDLYAISGTNGKTTTVSLLQAILAADGRRALAGGNIGVPLTTLVDSMEAGVIVVEASSFQLETTCHFRPNISALLNITPDHLDRHKSMERYIKAKSRIFSCQNIDDYAVLNYEDLHIREMAQECPARVIYFSSQRVLPEGAFIKDNLIYFVMDDKVLPICPVHEVSLRGQHNLENILGAVAVAAIAGAKVETIRDILKTFTGVRHRIEEVVAVDGVLYVNDSKATNPESAIKALESFNEPIILIAGGRSKGSSFEEFARFIKEKVKELVLLGEAREEIRKAVMDAGFQNIHEVNDFNTAVATARELAADGDVVLLSPACASWDMFKSYEQRGDLFCELVRAMQPVQGG
ncbi:MAG: UDP-N-acetylmuramoyl-L-alanine--D-glutamate ligase [Syntrophomonadaceae bacterium]|nr:UDP-N-acetylmuramoyl-L-alanine--D-glutamate ligase [Syntrophomonadaceae bacterium]